MVRVRKLVLAIAAASALSSGAASALGLGEVDLKSSLSQPLVAEIELLQVRDLAPNEVVPNLASPEEFTKAGVDRQYFLTDLKFTPVIKPNGKSVIRVTSSKPVREPYLNFLVEVLWPNGRLLREYTLLLDPPLYSPQSVVAPAPRMPVAASAPVTRSPVPVPPARTVVPVRPAAPSTASAPITRADGNTYKTTSSDTLWEIAQRSRQSGSVHQAMLAIQDLNPDAFIGGNINRLKSGQVLRLPSAEQIQARGQAEAIAQVSQQNAAWREGRNLASGETRQLDATKRATAGEAPAKADTKDSLKLVSGESGKATAGSDSGASNAQALSDELAVAEESLDTTRRENEELKGRMTDLQVQLDKLQRLIELKDNQLAKLQADVAQQGQAASPAVVPEPAPASNIVPQTADSAGEQPVLVSEPAKVEPAKAQAETDFNYSEGTPAAEEASSAPTEPAVKEAAPVVSAPEQAKPTPATPAVQSEPPTPGMFDQLMANPIVLGALGGGALLALLIGLMVLSRRNAMKEAELQQDLDDSSAIFTSDMDLPDDGFADIAEDLEHTQVRDVADERAAAQTADALGEADIYIAYGKFTQAAELLQNAINDEPQRSDLRLKLMEVYAEMGDRDGFARQEQELGEIGGVYADVDRLKVKYPAMAAVGLVAASTATAMAGEEEFSLDDLALDEPESVQAAATLDDDFDLSFDDLDADLSVSLGPQAEVRQPVDELAFASEFIAPANGEMPVGFDLPSEAASDSLVLDAGLDEFSLDLEEEAVVTEAGAADEFLLSLDDDAVSLEAESDLPADFDLSLDDLPLAGEEEAESGFAAQLDEVSAELEELKRESVESRVEEDFVASSSAVSGQEDDFDFLSGTDETATKLDLARAYIDMGDSEGARDILDEVVVEGSDGQQQEARELIAKLS